MKKKNINFIPETTGIDINVELADDGAFAGDWAFYGTKTELGKLLGEVCYQDNDMQEIIFRALMHGLYERGHILRQDLKDAISAYLADTTDAYEEIMGSIS